MSDQPEQTHIYAAPPITQFENISSQPVPPLKVLFPISLPLTRGMAARKQIIWMVLYSLFMILNIVGSIFYMSTMPYLAITTDFLIYLLPAFYLLGLVFPASSVLCGILFGSWRGTIVSCCSIGGGLFLVVFLHLIPYWNYSTLYALPFFIPAILATFLVGLLYDLRRYRQWWKSLLIILAGVFIGMFCFFLFGMFGAIASAPLFPTWIVFLVIVEAILERSIARWRRRHDATKEVPHANFSYETSVASDQAESL